MSNDTESFFKQPIIDSPYAYPSRHWELKNGQPTGDIIEERRRAEFLTPIPRPRTQVSQAQSDLDFDADGEYAQSTDQRYDPFPIINQIRNHVDAWRNSPQAAWKVTPTTARLLDYWRNYDFQGVRPFFCQLEAVETAIWLTEVAPGITAFKSTLEHLKAASENANPGLLRTALKLATGSGKTTVMAMIIAWQTLNAVRHPESKTFSRGFLIVTPGITIKDRLRVLLPNDPDSYYKNRELVPADMLPDMQRAQIIITNYHAFKLRETLQIASGTRALLQGQGGEPTETLETEGQMLRRVMAPLMSLKHIIVLNDEAHHCYCENPESTQEKLKGDEKDEAEANNKAARLWLSGLKMVQEKIGISRVFDLSATPFFLAGSGYIEGTLFPWTVCDFSLMDAIECGIVKLPRVPVADDLPIDEMPMFRNLWVHIGKGLPKKGRGKTENLDPTRLPTPLYTAIETLYKHYEKTFELWRESGIKEPPCFIIVCNNTATSKLVYDYLSGYMKTCNDGREEYVAGHCPLFRNHDEYGNPLPRPRTLLIDSEQLESGEALDSNFRKAAEAEIEQFRQDIIERNDGQGIPERLTDEDLLREVMNTVGKVGKLGESVRCVVSVSMLTEGWDANTVTHILGVRAFGTQLLCEQVVGRALRRQSYELNDKGLFDPEYADVFGIPFAFTAQPVKATPQPPKQRTHVHAVRPERDELEITFPRIVGYWIDKPDDEKITAEFTEESRYTLTQAEVGPCITNNLGIIGEAAEMQAAAPEPDRRVSEILYQLTSFLLEKMRVPGGELPMHQFFQLKIIVREWLENYLKCEGSTYPAQITYRELAERACQRIIAAINREKIKSQRAIIRVVPDPYNPEGSTNYVNFFTSKTMLWDTAGVEHQPKNHINCVVCDSTWEQAFCRIAELHPRVRAYTKNQGLDFKVPYTSAPDIHNYYPDFLLKIDDGRGEDDLLNLIVEIKGFDNQHAKDKEATLKDFWLPGVNALGSYGRWSYAKLNSISEMEKDFEQRLSEAFNAMIEGATHSNVVAPYEEHK